MYIKKEEEYFDLYANMFPNIIGFRANNLPLKYNKNEAI